VTAVDTAVRIEAAGIGDLADVMVAMRDAFDPEFGEAWTEAQCAGILGMPGSRLFIARRGLDPAGFAMTRTLAGDAELLLLAVRRGYRRAGIARQLLDRATVEARNDGAEALHLEVRDGNGAVQLYQGAGFEQVGRRRNYYRGVSGKVFDALTFRLKLARN
jgi:[ribosomal protein S18]-alanine N-acetyltransferase